MHKKQTKYLKVFLKAEKFDFLSHNMVDHQYLNKNLQNESSNVSDGKTGISGL